MYFINLKMNPFAIDAKRAKKTIHLLKKYCIKHDKFVELNVTGKRYTISGKTEKIEITGEEFVASVHSSWKDSTKLYQLTNQDILVSILPASLTEMYDLTKVETFDLISASFFSKNARYYFVLASALLFSSIFADAALLDGDMTDDDILQAMRMLKETLGFTCKIPVLWDKIRLLERCAKLTNNELWVSWITFDEFYRGKNKSVDERFATEILTEELKEIRDSIWKKEKQECN